MKSVKRFSFSLPTIFLATTIVALSVSHIVMMRELQQARSELEFVRKEFGYLHVDDSSRIQIARIEAAETNGARYRLRIPPGHRFLLRMADTEFSSRGAPKDSTPTQTLAMNRWREGGDVILGWEVRIDGDGTPRLVVSTDSEPQLIDYRLEGWKPSPRPNLGTELSASPQKSFSPDEAIHLMKYWNGETNRGVMLWIEAL